MSLHQAPWIPEMVDKGQRKGGDANNLVHWLSLPVAKMAEISPWLLRPFIPQEESNLFFVCFLLKPQETLPLSKHPWFFPA